MGTGSEPPRTLELRKNAAGSVPVPFFHGAPARKRGQAPSATRITTAIPVIDGASPHFRSITDIIQQAVAVCSGTARQNGKRGQAPSATRIVTAMPVIDGASPHF
ncbi:MAG: hypothetical protein V3V75_08385 [Thermoguttaceae bacterium]